MCVEGVNQIKRVVCSLVLLAWLPIAGHSAEPVAPASGTEPQRYAGKSDRELTALTAQWDSLDESQRRALLTEVKRRMARSKGREGVIHIRTQRRYGRIIRKSDGSVVHIQTRVVRVRPVPPDAQSYGVGFERRTAGKEAEQETPPVLTVKDPSP